MAVRSPGSLALGCLGFLWGIGAKKVYSRLKAHSMIYNNCTKSVPDNTRYFVALIHPIWHVRRYRVALINKLCVMLKDREKLTKFK
jgi:hypothetical protein